MQTKESVTQSFWNLFQSNLNKFGNPFSVYISESHAIINRTDPNFTPSICLDYLEEKSTVLVKISLGNDFLLLDYLYQNLKINEKLNSFTAFAQSAGINGNFEKIEYFFSCFPSDENNSLRAVRRLIDFLSCLNSLLSRLLPGFFDSVLPSGCCPDNRPVKWNQLLSLQEYLNEENMTCPTNAKVCSCERPSRGSTINRHPSLDSDLVVVHQEKMCMEAQNIILELDEQFSVLLLKLIDKKEMDEVACYKRAGVSRQTWYKILNEKDYRPGKTTVIAFALALRLSEKETDDLLKSVGFTLSGSIKSDLIVRYCLKNKIYNLQEVNDLLYTFDQPLINA